MSRYFFLLPVLLILIGCQSMDGSIKDSESRLEEVNTYPEFPELLRLGNTEMQLARKDFSGLELIFHINVENPNDFPIKFPEINWNYSVEGISVAKGHVNGTGGIAAGAVETQDINVSIVYEDIFNLVDSTKNAVEADGIFSFDIGTNGVMELISPIAILHEPEISFQGIRRQSLGRTMVFVFTWEVNNKNNFDMNISEFNYNIRINNTPWAADLAENTPKITANSRAAIPVTVSVSSPAIVAELVDILNRGAPVNYNNTGSMSIICDMPGLFALDIPLDFQGSTRIR